MPATASRSSGSSGRTTTPTRPGRSRRATARPGRRSPIPTAAGPRPGRRWRRPRPTSSAATGSSDRARSARSPSRTSTASSPRSSRDRRWLAGDRRSRPSQELRRPPGRRRARPRGRAGTIVALLGPNGAGKTTTVEIVEGYRRADAGEVRVLGLDPWRDGPALRARVGLMLQAGGIYPQARPRRDPSAVCPVLPRSARSGRAPRPGRPDRFGTRSHTASCRVASASAWGSPWRSSAGRSSSSSTSRRPGWTRQPRPRPGSSSPPCATRGVSVLLTTHELADAERLADRIAIVDRGRIVAEGRPAELTLAAARLRVRLRRPAVRWPTGPRSKPRSARTGRPMARRSGSTTTVGPGVTACRGPIRARRWSRR